MMGGLRKRSIDYFLVDRKKLSLWSFYHKDSNDNWVLGNSVRIFKSGSTALLQDKT